MGAKPPRAKKDEAALSAAVNSVKSKLMGYLKAFRLYHVPCSTILDKVHEKLGCRKGPNTVLSSREEDRLASWLIDMSKTGYGRSRQVLIKMVQNIERNLPSFRQICNLTIAWLLRTFTVFRGHSSHLLKLF